jgi:hypothetical protein
VSFALSNCGCGVDNLTDYEPLNTASLHQKSSESSQSHEMRQYNAFMARELPRLIRTSLEAALQDTLGPMEEVLKTQLESIIREQQDMLTAQYFSATGSLDCARKSSTGFGPTCQKTPELQDGLTASHSAQQPLVLEEDIWRHSVPVSSTDPSIFDIPPDSCVTMNSSGENDLFFLNIDDLGDMASDPDILLEDTVEETYTGKGKGRASGVTSNTDGLWGHLRRRGPWNGPR